MDRRKHDVSGATSVMASERASGYRSGEPIANTQVYVLDERDEGGAGGSEGRVVHRRSGSGARVSGIERS